VPRILQPNLKAVLKKNAWLLPQLFQWLQKEGSVADNEMHRVFNCGIGMVIVLAPEHKQTATELLTAAGEQVFHIGHIEQCTPGNAQTAIV
jgi:phosphoribosylformylglycinamidine cyclo-ligase